MKILRTIDDVLGVAHSYLGRSGWLVIDQDRIDLFAEATDDRQWIHVDPERAARGPYGGTIAHGHLTLSLVPRLTQEVFHLEGVEYALNYGLDRVRFLSPVPSGARICGEVKMSDVHILDDSSLRMHFETKVLLEGHEKPACVCNGIGLVRFERLG